MNAAQPPLILGAVLFPGFELLDVFGPLELFGMAGERFSIVMLADTPGEIPSGQGPKCVAEVSLGGTDRIDLLLVPGGKGTRTLVDDPRFLALLRTKAERASYVASVCTGSALLARSGFLDGKRATSNKRAFDWAKAQGPRTTWVPQARWVEDGRIFSSSGVSAGMDMALGIIERFAGPETSLAAARRAEYIWNKDKDFDPFSDAARNESRKRQFAKRSPPAPQSQATA